MKNYFEWEDGSLVVFDKVSKINIKEDIIEIYTNAGEYWILKLDNYIEQLTNYKAWLALKQQALEKNLENKANKPAIQMDDIAVSQPKWLIKAWESATDKKYKDLTKKDYKDFLAECEYILVYHGLIPVDKNIKLTNTKLKLKPEITEELFNFILNNAKCEYCYDNKYFNWCKSCHDNECFNWCKSCHDFDKFNPDSNKLAELNRKWLETK